MTIKRPYHPVLIIDDDPEVLRSTALLLKSAGFNNIQTQSDPLEVMPYLAHTAVELVLLDLIMPQVNGEELLASLVRSYPEIPVVVLTSANDVETAVRCMQLGASDYMVKPFEKQKLVCLVHRLNEITQFRRENSELRNQLLFQNLGRPDAFAGIVTNNKTVISICNYLNSSAVSQQTVLICGETGVGKELFARSVHTASARAGPFVAVNLAGIDDVVFTDTLFGHRKGAFTGADSPRAGLIKNAEGGTLFLDEIGDLSLQSQIKLLRLLQEGEYFPLGSDVPQRSEACLVLATNTDLSRAVQDGTFRRDLYFRISAHQVTVPPLRDRPEDISLLVRHFVEKEAARLGKDTLKVPDELFELLKTYSFPGNVRELEAMISEAVSQSSAETLELQWIAKKIEQTQAMIPDLPKPVSVAPASETFVTLDHPFPTLKMAEEWLIRKAMERSNNNQSVAASLLGISRQTLNGKLKKPTMLKNRIP